MVSATPDRRSHHWEPVVHGLHDDKREPLTIGRQDERVGAEVHGVEAIAAKVAAEGHGGLETHQRNAPPQIGLRRPGAGDDESDGEAATHYVDGVEQLDAFVAHETPHEQDGHGAIAITARGAAAGREHGVPGCPRAETCGHAAVHSSCSWEEEDRGGALRQPQGGPREEALAPRAKKATLTAVKVEHGRAAEREAQARAGCRA